MTVSIIVAVGDNGVIGRNNGLPWHLRADLRRFKRLTTGHHLIIGRRTWESVGTVLPGRTMIVVTSHPGEDRDRLFFVPSLARALAVADGDDEVFIGGGSGIYREALTIADRIYLTRVHAEPEGDARFPAFAAGAWLCRSSESHPADENNEFAYTFELLERAPR
jgi:dihydrofolate reductase